MWSEHCSYKSSRVHLRSLPTTGPRVLQGPGRERRRGRHRRRARGGLQDREPQPSFVHRAIPRRGDRRRRDPARRVHHGRPADRQLEFAALRCDRASTHVAARQGRGRGHRRIREQRRSRDGRRGGVLRPRLRREHSRQRLHARPRAGRRDLSCRRLGSREPGDVCRLRDGARRHSRREHGVGRVRSRFRGEAPDRAGRRSFHREAPARSVPRADGRATAWWRSRTWERRGSPARRSRWRVGEDSASRSTSIAFHGERRS